MAQFILRVMHDFRSPGPRTARTVLDDIRTAAMKRNEAALWELWAEAAAVSFGGDLTSLIHNSVIFGPIGGQDNLPSEKGFFRENPLVTRDPAAAMALLEGLRHVAARRDEIPLWKAWTYAALGLMQEVASRDPIAALGLLHDVLSVTAAKSDGELLDLWRPYVGNIVNAAMEGWLAGMPDTAKARYDTGAWEQWTEAALILMRDLRSVIPAPIAAGVLLAEMRAVAAARNEAALWESWAAGSIILMDRLQSRDLDAARALLEDMHGVAEARDEAALWASWAQASANLVVSLGSRDPAASRALVNDLFEAVNKHPGEVGGWQTAVVGLVIQVGVVLTRDLGLQDPDAARAFCAETLGMPESMLQIVSLAIEKAGAG
jgi:hypothetical protein